MLFRAYLHTEDFMMMWKRLLSLQMLFVLDVMLTWTNILFVVIDLNMLSIAADHLFLIRKLFPWFSLLFSTRGKI